MAIFQRSPPFPNHHFQVSMLVFWDVCYIYRSNRIPLGFPVGLTFVPPRFFAPRVHHGRGIKGFCLKSGWKTNNKNPPKGWFFHGDSITLPETNSSHLKSYLPKRKLVFQPSIFRCYVSFREGKTKYSPQWWWKMVIYYRRKKHFFNKQKPT